MSKYVWDIAAKLLLLFALVYSIIAFSKDASLYQDIPILGSVFSLYELNDSAESNTDSKRNVTIHDKKEQYIQKIITNADKNTTALSSYADAYNALDDYETDFRETEQEKIASRTVNLRNYYLLPVSVILGFLAILYLIIIEKQRLDNEREHNRKKAKDNLKDLAVYGKELFEDIDRLHYDFMFYQNDLRQAGLEINIDSLNRYSSMSKYYNKDNNSFSSELIAQLYTLLRKENGNKTILEEIIENYTKNKEKIDKTIESLYLQTLSQNFDEYIDSHIREETNAHTILEDIESIGKRMGEIILIKDFNVEENHLVVKSYLKINNLLKKFQNIIENSSSKKLDEATIINTSVERKKDEPETYMSHIDEMTMLEKEDELLEFSKKELKKHFEKCTKSKETAIEYFSSSSEHNIEDALEVWNTFKEWIYYYPISYEEFTKFKIRIITFKVSEGIEVTSKENRWILKHVQEYSIKLSQEKHIIDRLLNDSEYLEWKNGEYKYLSTIDLDNNQTQKFKEIVNGLNEKISGLSKKDYEKLSRKEINFLRDHIKLIPEEDAKQFNALISEKEKEAGKLIEGLTEKIDSQIFDDTFIEDITKLDNAAKFLIDKLYWEKDTILVQTGMILMNYMDNKKHAKTVKKLLETQVLYAHYRAYTKYVLLSLVKPWNDVNKELIIDFGQYQKDYFKLSIMDKKILRKYKFDKLYESGLFTDKECEELIKYFTKKVYRLDPKSHNVKILLKYIERKDVLKLKEWEWIFYLEYADENNIEELSKKIEDESKSENSPDFLLFYYEFCAINDILKKSTKDKVLEYFKKYPSTIFSRLLSDNKIKNEIKKHVELEFEIIAESANFLDELKIFIESTKKTFGLELKINDYIDKYLESRKEFIDESEYFKNLEEILNYLINSETKSIFKDETIASKFFSLYLDLLLENVKNENVEHHLKKFTEDVKKVTSSHVLPSINISLIGEEKYYQLVYFAFELKNLELLYSILLSLTSEVYKYSDIKICQVDRFEYFITMCKAANKDFLKGYRPTKTELKEIDERGKEIFLYTLNLWNNIEKYTLLFDIYNEFLKMQNALEAKRILQSKSMVELYCEDFITPVTGIFCKQPGAIFAYVNKSALEVAHFDDSCFGFYFDNIKKYLNKLIEGGVEEIYINGSTFDDVFFKDMNKIFKPERDLFLFVRFLIEELNSKYFFEDEKKKLFDIIEKYLKDIEDKEDKAKMSKIEYLKKDMKI